MSTPTPEATLPPGLRLGPVHLRVANLDRALAWYTTALGLQVLRREGHEAALGTATARTSSSCTRTRSARPAGRHAGLYHYALLYPSREELARAAVRLSVTGTPVDGASDHETHEAIYLPDADGNGIELAADRPRDAWPPSLGYAGGPQPLDVEDLLSTVAGEEPATEAAPGPARRARAPARRRPRARPALLPRPARLRRHGAPAQRRLRGRRRLPPPPRLQHLAGRGRAARPRRRRRPRHWTLVLPDPADVAARPRARSSAAGVPVEDRGDGAFLVRDPWSIPPARHGRRGGGVSPGPQGPMVPREPPAAHPIDPGVRVGHVHLRTADIDRVRAFYVDLLGFDVVIEARDVPGWGTTGDLLFVSAGGYHHHLGFNTWKSAGGGPQPDGVAGLHHVALNWPTRRPSRRACGAWSTRACRSGRPATTAPTSRSTSPIPTATTSSSPGTARSDGVAARRRRAPRGRLRRPRRRRAAGRGRLATVAAGRAPAVAAAGAAGVAAARAQPRRRAASSACCSDER